MKIIIYTAGLIFILFFAVSCKEKMAIITKDYVINPNWDKYNNSFVIRRMKPKYDNQIIDLKAPSVTELYHGLVEDTIFSYMTNVKYNGQRYAKRKVYFNKDNGFLWRGNPHKSSSAKSTLGDLQQNTWYLLLGLSENEVLYYVYIDSMDSLNVYKIKNMTNY